METAHFAAIFRRTLWLSGAAIVASGFFWDLSIFLGVLLGAGLATANFYVLRRIIEAGAQADSRRQGLLSVLFFVKFAALIGLVYVVVIYAPVNMVAFLIGISAAFVALLGESLRTMLRAGA